MRALSLVCMLAIAVLLSCADKATIGGLCPPGCDPRPKDGICDCSASAGRGDAGACIGNDCAQDASVPAQSEAADGGTSACMPRQLARRQLDLIVVFDDSASLAPWYLQVYEGFRAFIRDEASSGIGLGVLRFGDSCDVPDYLPPLVPVGALPDNIAAIDAVLPAGALSTNSTLPALDAAEQYAQRWATDHPGAHVSVLLLTDASPGGCDALNGTYDVEAARLAGAAHASSPSIDTYVVAPGSFELVDGIARAGGTELQRLPITATSDDVLAALRVVRGAARSCELAIPSGAVLTAGMQVVVDGEAFEIGPDSAACGRTGFFIADANISACPQTCSMLDGAQQIMLSGMCDRAP
jgi:hypothetical protein